MPARPISPETLHLIDAVRDALAGQTDVEEKAMFGCLVFMVNGKMCLGVSNDELLVRLPPATHDAVAEMPGLRPLSARGVMLGYFLVGPAAYATRDAWQGWIDGALAFNPLAKATPKRKPNQPDANDTPASTGKAATARKRHSVFDADD